MNSTPETAGESPPPSLGMALIFLAAVIVGLIGFLAIAHWLALAPLYAGFLALWYWANVDKLSFAAAPAMIVGAIGGTGTAWALQVATAQASTPGIVAVLLFIALTVLLLILKIGRFVINDSFMLFLTVCAAPLLQGGEDFGKVMITILVASAYFGALAFAGMKLFGGTSVEQAAEERIGVES